MALRIFEKHSFVYWQNVCIFRVESISRGRVLLNELDHVVLFHESQLENRRLSVFLLNLVVVPLEVFDPQLQVVLGHHEDLSKQVSELRNGQVLAGQDCDPLIFLVGFLAENAHFLREHVGVALSIAATLYLVLA